MTEEGLRVGQLVRSKAGRDAGSYFLVVGVQNARWVMVADGRLRKVGRPKKKNVKHLEAFSLRVKEAEARFAPTSVVTDHYVAEALQELLTEMEQLPAFTAAERNAGFAASVVGGNKPGEDV